METQILIEMAKRNNLYGMGAKFYMNDKEKSRQFLIECMEQIIDTPSGSEEIFGEAVVTQVKEYFKANPIENKTI